MGTAKNARRSGLKKRPRKPKLRKKPNKMALQTYTYDGPERFHSLVGQVMASLAMSAVGKAATSELHHL